MTSDIPPQHPAVVQRSHYQHERALLATAMVAVVFLSVAVVALTLSKRRAFLGRHE